MTRRILHPSDFSSASNAAFKKTIEMAKASRAELLIVHVINPIIPVAGEGYVSPKMYEDLAESTRAWARKQLERLLAKAKKSGVRGKGVLAEGAARASAARGVRRLRGAPWGKIHWAPTSPRCRARRRPV
jgi:nucleotide-binding universal stress UspA family protein